MSSYTIEDKVISKIATNLYIGNVTCDIFQNAWYNAILKDAKDEVVFSEIITLTPEEYSQWGSSDTYIVDLTCQKLGVVIKPVDVSSSS